MRTKEMKPLLYRYYLKSNICDYCAIENDTSHKEVWEYYKDCFLCKKHIDEKEAR